MPSNHLIHCCPLFLLPSQPSGSFPKNQFLESNDRSIGGPASASVLPMNIQGWFPSGLTCLVSLQSQGLSRVFSNTTVQNHQFFSAQLCFIIQLSHPYITTEKIIAFLPRSKCLLILWLQSPSAVILEPKKIKSLTVSIVSHLFAMKWWDQMSWSSFSECCFLSQLFHYPLSLSSRGSLVLHFLS